MVASDSTFRLIRSTVSAHVCPYQQQADATSLLTNTHISNVPDFNWWWDYTRWPRVGLQSLSLENSTLELQQWHTRHGAVHAVCSSWCTQVDSSWPRIGTRNNALHDSPLPPLAELGNRARVHDATLRIGVWGEAKLQIDTTMLSKTEYLHYNVE